MAFFVKPSSLWLVIFNLLQAVNLLYPGVYDGPRTLNARHSTPAKHEEALGGNGKLVESVSLCVLARTKLCPFTGRVSKEVARAFVLLRHIFTGCQLVSRSKTDLLFISQLRPHKVRKKAYVIAVWGSLGGSIISGPNNALGGGVDDDDAHLSGQTRVSVCCYLARQTHIFTYKFFLHLNLSGFLSVKLHIPDDALAIGINLLVFYARLESVSDRRDVGHKISLPVAFATLPTIIHPGYAEVDGRGVKKIFF